MLSVARLLIPKVLFREVCCKYERHKAHLNLQVVFVVEKLADGDVVTGFIQAIHILTCRFFVAIINNNEFIASVLIIIDEVRSVDTIYACC